MHSILRYDKDPESKLMDKQYSYTNKTFYI